MLNISAVVVWYHPDRESNNKAVKNVQSYANKFNQVYIVDNSDIDNSQLASQISNAIYIGNMKNLGIATALNQGCERAKKDGFTWIMTMDQDSFFEEEQLEKFLLLTNQYINDYPQIKSFSPMQNDTGENVLSISKKTKILIKKYLKIKNNKDAKSFQPETEYLNMVMASANIINLDIWEKIGKFDDSLFIDEVDHDFCIRLRLADYHIIRFNTVYVNHTLGNKKQTLFTKIGYESDFRLFYIFRNLMIMNRRYKNCSLIPSFKKHIWYYLRDYCILDFHCIRHIIIFLKAYADYKRYIKQ